MNYNNKLLSREDFKTQVFKRDKHTCVFCTKPAVDAHHIFDRKLFKDGGYYLNNGASVCEEHHWACEKTDISLKEVWDACKIVNPVYPQEFDASHEYDKWGNIVLGEKSRKAGPMFFEENVQKILKNKLWLFEIK